MTPVEGWLVERSSLGARYSPASQRPHPEAAQDGSLGTLEAPSGASLRGGADIPMRQPRHDARHGGAWCVTVLLVALVFALPVQAQSNPQGRDAHAGSAGRDARAAPGASVDGFLALVRQFNPELAGAALEREAAVARIGPAGALDDPSITVSRDQGFRQTMATVSQEFPLWGKRELRREVARHQASAARGREDTFATEIEQRVKVAFAHYHAASRSIRVTEDIRSLLRLVENAAKARYSQGLASQSDAIRAAVEQTRLVSELPMHHRNQNTAQARLNALIGRSADTPLVKPAVLRPVPRATSLPFEDLLSKARFNNPGLAMARADIAAAKGERELVDKSYYPDVTLSAGITDMPEMDPRFVGSVGIKIPLQWGVREAQAREATAKRGAAQARLDASMLEIQSGLQEALASLRAAQEVEDLLKHGQQQQTEAAYRSALAAYQLGRGDLTAVLEAARQQLQVRLEVLKLETEQQAALADIERLIGENL